jgi:predicted ATPase
MITSLALSNFKSIGETLIENDEGIAPGKIEFAPLTIFCGKNSSGKSTVLQSILLLSQTLKNNEPSQTLVLNGPMVKLGSVNDIKSSYLNSKDVTIDINLSISESLKDKNILLETLDDNYLSNQKNNTECKEEEITLEGYGNLKYSLSNNFKSIEKAIFSRTGYNFRIYTAEWKVNPSLSEKVKELMRKHDVKYSMTTYYNEGIRIITINRYFENDWHVSIYAEINGDFYEDMDFDDKPYIPNEKNEKIFDKNEDDIIAKQNINLKLSFCNNKSIITNILPIINKINIENEYNINDSIYTTNFIADYANKIKSLNIIVKDKDEYARYNLNFDIVTKCFIKDNYLHFDKLVGLKLNHFLPDKLIYLTNPFNKLVNYFSYLYFNRFLNKEYIFNNRSVNNFNESIMILSKFIDKFFPPKNINLSESLIHNNSSINDLQAFQSCVKKNIFHLKKKNITKLLFEAMLQLSKESKTSKILLKMDDNFYKHITRTSELVSTTKNDTDSINNVFKNNIIYIGPLREEPYLHYNEYSDNLTNIDIKGKNCASVLFYKKNKILKFIRPLFFAKNDKQIKPFFFTLNEIVNDWLQYIGIAKGVDVKFNGKYGYELKINSFIKKENDDLTNVGVGVSQVLPIVLACLLAPKESTIIIEQPELHLHPAMQTKLTDFFIATMLCNKQLIIETHSEYIINQLRLRVVNCPTKETINDKLMIYFTDNLKEDNKEYKAGNTTFRKLEINEYAAMSDWPDGFFDESSKTAKQIMNEVIKKMEDNSQND